MKQLTQLLQSVYLNQAKEIPPLVKKTIPWWNEECTIRIKDKKKALNKFSHTKLASDYKRYKALEKLTKTTIKKAKETSWREYCSTLEIKPCNSKQVWSKIKTMQGKSKTSTLNIKNTTNNKEKAEIIANYFAGISKNSNHTQQFQKYRENLENKHPEYFKDRDTRSSPLNAAFTLSEWKKAIKHKKSTSPGEDNLGYEIYKNIPQNIENIILDMINLSWQTGIIPKKWKEAIVIPIPKIGKDPTELTSYRPISLTDTICKITETMINNRLKYHLESNNLLSNNQSGFRNNRSTLDQLIRLESNIKLAFNNKYKSKRYLIAIFLDLEKAFDLVWTNGLMAKLNHYGINGNMFNWIKNFLTNRHIRARIGDQLSDEYSLENGTPQGSVLSPTLFNIMINDLGNTAIKTEIDLSQFADDSGIWKNGNPKSQKLITEIQLTLNNISKWADKWGFKLSKGKTIGIIFSPPHKRPIQPPSLYIQGELIKFEKTAKFLGMYFDHHLTWNHHINELIIKCNRDLNLMRNIKGFQWGANQNTLTTLYRTLIRSKLDYGCQVYASAKTTILKRLDKIQIQALRICTGSLPNTSKEELLILTGELPLSLRREELLLRYAARISPHTTEHPTRVIIQKCNTLFNNKLVPNPPSGKLIHTLCEELQINQLQAESFRYPDPTPWKIKQPIVNTIVTTFGSKEINPLEIKNHVLNLLSTIYKDYVKIYTDGSKTQHPDRTAAALVIPEQQIQLGSRLPNQCSIYTAEFWAIFKALKLTQDQQYKNTLIISDSLSVLKTLDSQQSKGRDNLLKDVLLLIRNMTDLNQNIEFLWIPSHIDISGNEQADSAAKNKLTDSDISNIDYSVPELYSIITKQINQKWQKEWNLCPRGRLLYLIQPTVSRGIKGPILNNTHYQYIINRIRTGKTLLASSLGQYIADLNTNGTKCPHCNCIENLQHIFNSCYKYKLQRNQLKNSLRKIGSPITYPEFLLDSNTNPDLTNELIISFIIKINKLGKI